MNNVIYVNADMTPIAYAWPGGYPVFYIATWKDHQNSREYTICPRCARRAKAIDYVLETSDINWENNELSCDECDGMIESAYSE